MLPLTNIDQISINDTQFIFTVKVKSKIEGHIDDTFLYHGIAEERKDPNGLFFDQLIGGSH